MNETLFLQPTCSINKTINTAMIENQFFAAKKRKIPRRIILKRLAILRMRAGNFGFLYFEGMEIEMTISNIGEKKNLN